MSKWLARLKHAPQEATPDQVPEVSEVRLTMITCRHCGACYWHHLGHLATGGKIAGGPCCFGHSVLDVATYPTEEQARQAYPWPEESGDPEHGSCCKCGADTTACTTYPDRRMQWVCGHCYSKGARPLPDTQKAVTGEMVRSDYV